MIRRTPGRPIARFPALLFGDIQRFEQALPGLEVIHNRRCECFVFLLSGGVIAKTRTINLPPVLLRAVHRLDQLLIGPAAGGICTGPASGDPENPPLQQVNEPGCLKCQRWLTLAPTQPVDCPPDLRPPHQPQLAAELARKLHQHHAGQQGQQTLPRQKQQ